MELSGGRLLRSSIPNCPDQLPDRASEDGESQRYVDGYMVKVPGGKLRDLGGQKTKACNRNPEWTLLLEKQGKSDQNLGNPQQDENLGGKLMQAQ
jgi:hypothetical protein